jgi:hypothetical protein
VILLQEPHARRVLETGGNVTTDQLKAAGHRIQLAIRERAVIFERGVIEVRGLVGFAHDLSLMELDFSRVLGRDTLDAYTAGHCIQLAIRERAVIFERGMTELRGVVRLAHEMATWGM